MNVPVPDKTPVPPLAETVTVAVPPGQTIGVVSVTVTEIAVGSVMVIELVPVQPFASVTI